MREIKFRAWDTEHNEFIYFELNQILERRLSDANNLSSVTLKILKAKVKQQFTGLKDKNGKEIYEGDIVEHFRIIGTTITTTKAGVIIFAKGCFKSMVNGGIWDIRGDKDDKIIGNIWENPEILGDTK